MDRTQQDVDELINAASLEQLRELARTVFGITRDAMEQPTATDYDFGGTAHSDAIVDAKFAARNDLALDIENTAIEALTPSPEPDEPQPIEVGATGACVVEHIRWGRRGTR
ncbi:hypothetical protein [Streptomyces sp. NPDC051572]|jgi:hypothetical protein|uniref:hypothetical protein n=1 Tax=Streptomyces sp. NPDC051572 TaxID=3155802 RepID=UPI00344E624A